MSVASAITYDLVEIFESLQGEGRNSGRSCVFVRFAGCNLACPWCDTCVTKRFTIAREELLAEVTGYRARNVILTGGEPTIQPNMAALVADLKAAGFWIAVETNGTTSRADAPWLDFVDYVACSPKVEYADRLRLEAADEVRVVASSPDMLDFCRDLPERIAATDYYISPCEREGTFDFATAKGLLGALTGWSLSVQLHKLLGFR